MAWYHDFYVRHGALLIPLFDIVEAEGLTETHLSFLDRALEELPEGARILDLGCGVGRLAIPLAARGYRVTCYDVSPPLLEEARRRARDEGVQLEVVEGDMLWVGTALKGRKYDAVIAMWNTIPIMDYDQAESVLMQLRGLLRKGGKLLMDVTNRDYMLTHFQGEETEESEDFLYYMDNEVDWLTSTLRSQWRIYRKEGEEMHLMATLEHRLRLYSVHELYDLLTDSGFRPSFYGSFQMEELDVREDDPIVVVAEAF